MTDNSNLYNIAVRAMTKYMLTSPKNAKQLIISVCAIKDLAKATGEKDEIIFHYVFLEADKIVDTTYQLIEAINGKERNK